MKKIIIIGASSGMGMRIATDFARLGWRVGIAARREDRLKAVKDLYPDRIEYMTIDVTAQDAVDRFYKLIELIDGMDYLLYAAGCGWRGHIAVITSVAGVKGIGISATYSASKRYQWTYLQALDQLAHQQHVNVAITDIRPGFVDTPLLAGDKNYPLLMSIDYVAPRIERAIMRGRRIAVVDSRWAVVTALWRLVPDPLWRRLQLNLGE